MNVKLVHDLKVNPLIVVKNAGSVILTIPELKNTFELRALHFNQEHPGGVRWFRKNTAAQFSPLRDFSVLLYLILQDGMHPMHPGRHLCCKAQKSLKGKFCRICAYITYIGGYPRYVGDSGKYNKFRRRRPAGSVRRLQPGIHSTGGARDRYRRMTAV